MDKNLFLEKYKKIKISLEKYIKDIEIIVKKNIGIDNKNRPTFEGNCFYENLSFNRSSALLNKQVNLYWSGSTINRRVCEIGFNAGHSALLMLLGAENKDIEFTIFDIGQHDYTALTIDYIKSKFLNVTFEYIEGNSIETIPVWIEKNKNCLGTYDLIHVDGGHSEECIKNDMMNMDKLIKLGGIIIIDDTNASWINKYVDVYLQTGKYKEIHILHTPMYPHRMIQRI